MKIWIDAQLSPVIAEWFGTTLGAEAVTVKSLGFRDASDREIFLAARAAKAVILTKDRDLVHLVMQLGAPPQIVWLTSGNTSNHALKSILSHAWATTAKLLESGERVVEIGRLST